MSRTMQGFVSAKANFRAAKVKTGGTPVGRSQNEVVACTEGLL